MLTALPHQVLNFKRFGPVTTTTSGSTPGSQTTGTTTGTLSAASPSDIARLEEGKRSRQAFKFITSDLLYVAMSGGQLPDWIQVGLDWFEISGSNPYQNTVISHYEYIITKIENPGDYQ